MNAKIINSSESSMRHNANYKKERSTKSHSTSLVLLIFFNLLYNDPLKFSFYGFLNEWTRVVQCDKFGILRCDASNCQINNLAVTEIFYKWNSGTLRIKHCFSVVSLHWSLESARNQLEWICRQPRVCRQFAISRKIYLSMKHVNLPNGCLYND